MRDGSLRSLLEDYAHPPSPPLSIAVESGALDSRLSLLAILHVLFAFPGLVRGRFSWCVSWCVKRFQLLCNRETTHTNGQDRPTRTEDDGEWVCWGQLPYGIAFIERRTTVSGSVIAFSKVGMVASQILGILKGPDARNWKGLLMMSTHRRLDGSTQATAPVLLASMVESSLVAT